MHFLINFVEDPIKELEKKVSVLVNVQKEILHNILADFLTVGGGGALMDIIFQY
jgi:hypothetical protein